MATKKTIVGLGELLWDVLPDGKKLGGAPANFSVMSARLGNRAVIASRIGDDEFGREAMNYLEPLPAETEFIQVDPTETTGRVTVTFRNGQPEYEIHEPVAWDCLAFTPEWRDLAAETDAVCFGTLAQRSVESRTTIHRFLAATRPDCARVFDVNLRRPFYSRPLLAESLKLATILKLNDAELPIVLKLLSLKGIEANGVGAHPELMEAGAKILLAEFPVELVCVTLGAHGSLLVSRSDRHYHPGIPVEVADTIGAGDAFTAALSTYYLKGEPLPVLNEAANRWGSWVASQSGGMPPLPEAVRAEIENAIVAVAS